MIFSRNLGLISEEEQLKLHQKRVLVAGVGGMGGVAAEVLVRMGIGHLVLCDFDLYEDVNSNRQIHCHTENYGKYKVDVLKNEFLKINPQLKIEVYRDEVSLTNVDKILCGIDVVVNGMDKMKASLILERTARQKNIIIVDAWLTPYASVFVMDSSSPHWEEFLDLPTKNIPLDKLTDEICQLAVKKEVQFTLSHFSPFSIIKKEFVEDILNEKRPRPSMAPVVWLSGVLMANEVFKIALGIPHVGHKGIFYNQYDHQLMDGNIPAFIKKVA